VARLVPGQAAGLWPPALILQLWCQTRPDLCGHIRTTTARSTCWGERLGLRRGQCLFEGGLDAEDVVQGGDP
jgi:hypothetical protein